MKTEDPNTISTRLLVVSSVIETDLVNAIASYI